MFPGGSEYKGLNYELGSSEAGLRLHSLRRVRCVDSDYISLFGGVSDRAREFRSAERVPLQGAMPLRWLPVHAAPKGEVIMPPIFGIITVVLYAFALIEYTEDHRW